MILYKGKVIRYKRIKFQIVKFSEFYMSIIWQNKDRVCRKTYNSLSEGWTDLPRFIKQNLGLDI